MATDTNRFFECGGCDHLHPYGWTGDCRNDTNRFTYDKLDELFGNAWSLVDEQSGELS